MKHPVMETPFARNDSTTRLVLKVDIDTKIGLLAGVPNLMETLKQAGDIKASFFIAMGPDNSGRALKRIFKPGFLRKQLKSGAASSYGLTTMLYGVILPAPIIAEQAPELFLKLLLKGHEVGLHGWDHVYWHDYVRKLPEPLIRAQLDQAARMFKKITGVAPAAFAAPGWQITNTAWQIMAEMGITHTSCVRGASPFRPLLNGRALPLLEIPTTMPSLDEALGRFSNADKATDWLAAQVKTGKLNVFTLHGEVEGRNFRPQFTRFLQMLQERDVRFITLSQAALNCLKHDNIKTGGFHWASVENRAGELAVQTS